MTLPSVACPSKKLMSAFVGDTARIRPRSGSTPRLRSSVVAPRAQRRAGSRVASCELDGQTSFSLPLTGEYRRESLERDGHVAIGEECGNVRHECCVVWTAQGAQHPDVREQLLDARRLLRLEPCVRRADDEWPGA